MAGDFGDISDRVGIVASTNLLADAKENLILDRWAMQSALPQNRGKTITWRRYNNLGTAISPIVGSNTPDAEELPFEDVTTAIEEFGTWIPISQRILDTHEDPILMQASDKLSFQLAKTIETLNYNVVKGGTSVVRTGGVASRSLIIDVVARKEFRAAVRILNSADAMPITTLVRSTPDYQTHGIEASFFAYAHTALAPAFRAMDGFLPVSQYSSNVEPLPGEIGNLENVRIVLSNIATPFVGAGLLVGPELVLKDSVSGKANVYPIIIFGREAFSTVSLSGKDAVRLKVHNPQVTESDPLAQRGSVGWITWYASVILNNDFMVRIETAAPSDAGLS